MLKLCDLLGIPLLDHIIVGGKNEDYFSFKERQRLVYENNRLETDYKKLEFPELHVAESSPEKSTVTPEEVPVRRRRGR